MNEKTLDPLPKLFSRSFIFLILTNFFIYLGFYILIPTLPTYVKEIGGSNMQASLVISIFSISALLLRTITGKVADTIGRKPLIILGFVFLMFSNVSYFFASIAGIIIFRFFNGIGWGMSSTTIATLVSDIVPKERRGEGMGYYSLSMIIAMSMSPLVGIMIMNTYSFKVILIIAVILLAIGILLFQAVSIPYVKKHDIKKLDKKSLICIDLFEKRALLPAFLCFFVAVTLCGIMSYIILFGREIGLVNIWVYFLGHVSMILITRSFVGKLFDRRGHSIIILPGAVLMTIGLIILSYTNSITTLVFASLFYGLGYGAVQPSLQAWAVNRSPSERRGAANGTFLSSMDLGFVGGSMILGSIAGTSGYAVMYRIASLFMLVFILIYILHLIKSKSTLIENYKEELS